MKDIKQLVASAKSKKALLNLLNKDYNPIERRIFYCLLLEIKRGNIELDSEGNFIQTVDFRKIIGECTGSRFDLYGLILDCYFSKPMFEFKTDKTYLLINGIMRCKLLDADLLIWWTPQASCYIRELCERFTEKEIVYLVENGMGEEVRPVISSLGRCFVP